MLFLGNGGYGTLVWVIVTEMLHPRVRAATNAVNICLSFILGFVVSKVFVDLSLAIGSFQLGKPLKKTQTVIFFQLWGGVILDTLFW